MKVAIIGVGNMGFAYASSLKGKIPFENILLIEPNKERAEKLKEQKIGEVESWLNYKISEADIVLIAVKPQSLKDLCMELKPHIREKQVIVSIMAGVEVAVISRLLDHRKIVRAMPNTPCQYGEGITGYYMTDILNQKEQLNAKTVLEGTGQLVKVDEERHIDAVTGLSGSGPAYFYFIADAMIKAGMKLGLDENQSKKLVLATMKGAHYMIEKESDKEIADLIAAVASKGGTTQAALDTLAATKTDENMEKTVFAAYNRAAELSKMIES